MKSAILLFIKIFFAIAAIEFLFFIMMIFFVMTDQPIGTVGSSLGVVIKYVLGFPLVLINDEYPFFINTNKPSFYMMQLVILNLFIQTGLICLFERMLKINSSNEVD